jgi:hypothetical protein
MLIQTHISTPICGRQKMMSGNEASTTVNTRISRKVAARSRMVAFG